MDWPLGFGVFLAPFHPAGQNPTLALQRDLETIELLDQLGYDEAWIGEHHSGGFEIIASPEVFIAAAAERTSRIRLGPGVVSLPYHHPLLVADRMVLLDHLTKGRVMLGVGPGALPSDAAMLGVDPQHQRHMMEQALEAIVALVSADGPVSSEAGWFTLRDARLQLRPYQHPCFEIAVAALISPAGPRAAGRFGAGLLSIGATSHGGYDALGSHWRIAEDRAAAFGTSVDRRRWRLVGPMHLAESEDQARRDVEFGLRDWVEYFRNVAALPLAPDTGDSAELVDALNASGFAVIGTPDQAVAQIQRLADHTGGFGTFLLMAHEWADPRATSRSYELFARSVMPAFQGSAEPAERSRDWAAAHRQRFSTEAATAVAQAVQDHFSESEGHSASD